MHILNTFIYLTDALARCKNPRRIHGIFGIIIKIAKRYIGGITYCQRNFLYD